jgi:hypothetical protein
LEVSSELFLDVSWTMSQSLRDTRRQKQLFPVRNIDQMNLLDKGRWLLENFYM